jgi:hypothetical protein
MNGKARKLAWLSAVTVVVVGGLMVEWIKEFPVLGYLWSLSTRLLSFLSGGITVPLWLMATVSLLSLAMVFIVVSRLRRIQGRPVWRNYIEDDFLDVTWMWRYSYNQIVDLVPMCPRCSYQMIFADGSTWRALPRVVIACQDCMYQVDFEGTPYELESRVRRLIERNIRTGNYGPDEPNPVVAS